MNGTELEIVHCVKDLDVTVAFCHKFYQQCKDAVGNANGMLGFMNRNLSIKKIIILPLYINLGRPYLEYVVQIWAHHNPKNIAKLEAVQRNTTKMITSLRNKSYKERLAQLNLLSREKRRL